MLYRSVIAVYGVINILGGVIGYVMARSIWSLVVGGVAGLLLLWFAWMAKTKPGVAYRMSAALAVALAVFWVFRINELTAAGRPAAMAIGNLALAVVVFLVLGGGHLLATRSKAGPS